MADAVDDVRENLEKQIADLKKEMAKISKSLAARSADAVEEAQGTWEEGKGRVRQMATQVRDQAHVAAGAMRENPGTTATVLSTVGAFGLLLGFTLGAVCYGDRHR